MARIDLEDELLDPLSDDDDTTSAGDAADDTTTEPSVNATDFDVDELRDARTGTGTADTDGSDDGEKRSPDAPETTDKSADPEPVVGGADDGGDAGSGPKSTAPDTEPSVNATDFDVDELRYARTGTGTADTDGSDDGEKRSPDAPETTDKSADPEPVVGGADDGGDAGSGPKSTAPDTESERTTTNDTPTSREPDDGRKTDRPEQSAADPVGARVGDGKDSSNNPVGGDGPKPKPPGVGDITAKDQRGARRSVGLPEDETAASMGWLDPKSPGGTTVSMVEYLGEGDVSDRDVREWNEFKSENPELLKTKTGEPSRNVPTPEAETVAEARAIATNEVLRNNTYLERDDVSTKVTDDNKVVASVDEGAVTKEYKQAVVGADPAIGIDQIPGLNAPEQVAVGESGKLSLTTEGETARRRYFREEFAKQYSQQTPADISADEVVLDETDGGYRGSLSTAAKREVYAGQIQSRRGIDADPGDITITDGDVMVTGGTRGKLAQLNAAGLVGGVTDRQRERLERMKLLQTGENLARGRMLQGTREKAVEQLESEIYGPFAALSGTELNPEDVTFERTEDGLQASPSEELRAKLEGSIEESLVRKLEDDTGVDLKRDDVLIEQTDEGYRAKLSEAGEKTVEIETTPGEDLPIVGGVTTTGTRARMKIRDVTDPAAETWREHTPSKKDVLGFAGAAAPVAVAEPTPAGEVGLAAIVGTGLGAATLQRYGGGLTGDTPQAQATAANPALATAEVGMGDPVTREELDVGRSPQDVSELTPNSRVRVNELSASGGFVEETRVRVPSGSIFSDELAVPDAEAGDSVTPVAGTKPVTQGALERAEPEVEEGTDDELGVPDDPWIVSDKRLYDPQRDFGEQEDVTESVDPTGDTFESEEDIGEGVAGEGEAMQPARDVDTVQENWEQFLEEEQARLEEAQRSSLIRDSPTFKRGSLAGFVTAGQLNQPVRQRLREAQKSSLQQPRALQELREVARQRPGQRPDTLIGVGQDFGLEPDTRGQYGEQVREQLAQDARAGEQEAQLDELLEEQTTDTAPEMGMEGLGYEYAYDFPTANPTGYPYGTPYGPGYGHPAAPGTPTGRPRIPTPEEGGQTSQQRDSTGHTGGVDLGDGDLVPGYFNEYLSQQAGVERGAPSQEKLEEAAAEGFPEALPTEGELESEMEFEEVAGFFAGEGTAIDFGDGDGDEEWFL